MDNLKELLRLLEQVGNDYLDECSVVQSKIKRGKETLIASDALFLLLSGNAVKTMLQTIDLLKQALSLP